MRSSAMRPILLWLRWISVWGCVTPQRFIAAHDVGQAINPLLVEGQVQGGIAQGIGHGPNGGISAGKD